VSPARAILFDFNGTLADDEPLLCRIFSELFAARGRPMPEDVYWSRLAGLSDPDIVRTWLGADHPAVEEVLRERLARYVAAAAGGTLVDEQACEAVRFAAARVPIAVVSGALRAEVESALEGAGLLELFAAVVSAEDVSRGKPDPEGYRAGVRALAVDPADAVAIEDADAGIAAALAAGMRCVAVEGTLPRARLAAAERIAPRLDRALVESLLAG
jgi:beta-phosphoglucomutase-like phosphatase (HAD superfamily)